MQKRNYIITVLICLVVTTLSLSAQVYHVPEQRSNVHQVGNAVPTPSEFRSTSSAIRSTSSFSGGYTIPFAAGNASEIGASSPTGGPRKAPPSIGGGFENQPDMPGFNDGNDQPIGDGLIVLLMAAMVYAIATYHRRKSWIKE